MDKGETKPISEKTALSRMMKLCSAKECCSYDIHQKMLRMQLQEDAIIRIISRLQENKFIDDMRYARSFVNDKLRFAKWGKMKIEYALRQKRIPDKIIAEIFSELSPEDLSDSLKPLLEKKARSVKGEPEHQKRTKLIRFGLSRGFTMQEILKCLNQLQVEE